MADPHGDRVPQGDPGDGDAADAPSVAAEPPAVDPADLAAAERVLGLAFDAGRRKHLPETLASHRRGVEAMRRLRFGNDLAPAHVFDARAAGAPLPPPRPPAPAGAGFGRSARAWDDLPFLTVAELAAALRRGEVTARALTDRYLARIDRHDPTLRAVITPLASRARAEAERADSELAAGIDRGPLHGVPYLAKDLLATPDAPTTWGAAPFRDQRLDGTATAVARLEEAGAVLLGKASLGALAMGDVWFDATTRNPWNLDEGSSGSSAGSAAAVAAGLCAFAIGSETMGSILSPAERCSVVGLRPTFGRVSRHGAMALSWSLDKLGPLTRSAEDAALILTQLAGVDPADPATREAPFPWDPHLDPASLRVGAPRATLEDPSPAVAAVLEALDALGVTVTDVELPDLPTDPIMTLLMVEASAAFDELVRGEGMDALVRQTADAWPALLRAARFVAATDYVQALRLQRRVRDEMAALFERTDLLLTSGTDAPAMLFGNAAGAPVATVPFGRADGGRPAGNAALLGRPFFEHETLALAHALERHRGPLPAPPAFAVDAAG